MLHTTQSVRYVQRIRVLKRIARNNPFLCINQQKGNKDMSNTTSALVDGIIALAEELADEAGKKPFFLKALLNQDRFKLSSVWVLLEDGNYQHLQSGRVTTASRLAGFTRVIDRG